MTDKKEKPKYYLGFIPKEQLEGFLERLKKALADGQKSGEKKDLEIEIRGAKEDPTGISVEVLTLGKDKFDEYFDSNAEHTKKALVAWTLNFEVKKPEDIETIKGAFEMIKPMFLQLPPIAAKPGKFELVFRNNGKKVAIDVISTEGKIIQPLLDLGINLDDYTKFYFGLKAGANLGKLYDEGANPSEELINEFFNLLISVKSSGENIKYLATALGAALKDVKIEDAKKQAKLGKLLGLLNLVNVFISGKMKLEFDTSVLKNEGKKEAEKLPGGVEGFKKQLSGYHAMAKGTGQNMVKPMVEGMGFGNAVKAINLDSITCAAGVPKYGNGVAVVLKLPGLTHVLEELLK